MPESKCGHFDTVYDSSLTGMLMAERGLQGAIACKGAARTAPGHQTLAGGTHPWHNNFYKLARCPERRQIVADFYIAFANTVVLVRILLRRAWILYRWDTQPSSRL